MTGFEIGSNFSGGNFIQITSTAGLVQGGKVTQSATIIFETKLKSNLGPYVKVTIADDKIELDTNPPQPDSGVTYLRFSNDDFMSNEVRAVVRRIFDQAVTAVLTHEALVEPDIKDSLAP